MPYALLAALLHSVFIYTHHLGIDCYLLNTFAALLGFYLMLQKKTKEWFFYGLFMGALWFWWMGVSFVHYNMAWGLGVVALLVSLGYGIFLSLLFYLFKRALGRFFIASEFIFLLSLSYIHPFGFDWYKPELLFTLSFLGVYKWQFAITLLALLLTKHLQNRRWLMLLILAVDFSFLHPTPAPIQNDIALLNSSIEVEQKWNRSLHSSQYNTMIHRIDEAISQHKSAVVLPESFFAIFLNLDKTWLQRLLKRSHNITIVTGGLYWHNKEAKNSAYIFKDGHYRIANKVILVPFGESNPLPDFASKWINEIFYDGAMDYNAGSAITDYSIGNESYRNAICFEATSSALYSPRPKQMIVLSNNGWFYPSIEPTLQQILLLFYNKKFSTTIYHVTNMSPAYIIYNQKVYYENF